MDAEEIKVVIKKIHKIWYGGTFLDDPRMLMELNELLEDLWNYAEITETLVENNPSEPTKEDFKRQNGIV